MRRLTRFTHLWFLVSLPLLAACGGQGSEAKSPDKAACADGSGEVESLPRYVSLELREEGPWLDGQRVSEVEMARALRDAASDPGVRGVAIVHEGGELSLQQVLTEVAKAGITHVVISGMLPEAVGPGDARLGETATGSRALKEVSLEPVAVEPSPVVAKVEPAPSAPVVAAPVAAPVAVAPAAAEPAASEAAVPEDVSVRHYGLHIGGIKDIDSVKDAYLKPIEKHFDEFRRCHALAKNRSLKASFGVDLLLSPSGGVPKVKDYRTQIKGKDFHLCALGVFAQVRWPVPEKPTIISYSLFFKPLGTE